MSREVPFEQLERADLTVGTLYRAGSKGTIADEPIAKLLRCGNMGGFRVVGRDPDYRLAVLFTTFEDVEWPDRLESEKGLFTYYGDNKEPGRPLHETARGGNKLLRRCFESIWVDPPHRERVPPFFVFSKAKPGRDMWFHGLAVPGAATYSETEDLVAIWRTRGSQRFQNYRAVFTVLDEDSIPRSWIERLLDGSPSLSEAPRAWREWVENGHYMPRRRRSAAS